MATIDKDKIFKPHSYSGTGLPLPTEGVDGSRYNQDNNGDVISWEKQDGKWVKIGIGGKSLIIREVDSIAELRNIDDLAIGEEIYCNGFKYLSVPDTSQIDDGGSIIRSNTLVFELKKDGEIIPVEVFEIKGDNTLIDKSKLDNLFNYTSKNNYTSFWKNGTYLFPFDYQHELFTGDLNIQGESKENTIWTTNDDSINSVKTTKKIDLKVSPLLYSDGMYHVFWTQINNDGTNGYHPNYPSNLSTGDYVKIINGIATKETLTAVKQANYVTPLDLNAPEPTVDGLYIVALGNFKSGGSFPNIGIDWSPNIEVGTVTAVTGNSVTMTVTNSVFKEDRLFIGQDSTKKIGDVYVIASNNRVVFSANLINTPVVGDRIYASPRVNSGSLLKKTGSNWERYNKACGLQFHKDLNVSDLKFKDVAFFLFDFMGKDQSNKNIEIKNSRFEDVRRVFAADRMQGGTLDGSIFWQTEQIQLKTIEDRLNYSFNSIKINNNSFERLHESVMMASPSFLNYEFIGNTVYDSDYILNIVNLLINPTLAGSQQFYVNNSNAIIRDNIIKNCVTLNHVNTSVNRSLFRVMGNTYFNNNKVSNSNGKLVYLAGSNSIISNNRYEGNIDVETSISQTSVIFFKIKGSKIVNKVFNNKISRTTGSFISINFPQSFYFENNEYQSKRFYEYCYSLTNSLDKDTSYKIYDLAKFKTLSINSDDILTKGDISYFSKTTNRWEKATKVATGNNVYEFSDEGGDIEVDVISKNNVFKCFDLYRIQGGIDSLNLKISDDISVTRLNQYAKNGLALNLDNSTVRVLITSSYIGEPIHYLQLSNTKFLLNSSSSLEFKYDKDLLLSNIIFKADPIYDNIEFFIDSDSAYKASFSNIKLTNTTDSNLTIKNCSNEVSYARNSGFENNGFDKVFIIGQYISFKTITNHVNDKAFRLLHNITSPSVIDINGVTIEEGTLPSSLVSFVDKTTIHNSINVKDMYVFNNKILNSIFDDIYNINDLKVTLGEQKINSLDHFSNISGNKVVDKSFLYTDLYPQTTAGGIDSENVISPKWTHNSCSIAPLEDPVNSGKFAVKIEALTTVNNRRKEILFDNLIVGKPYKFSCTTKRGDSGTTQRVYFTNISNNFSIIPLASFNTFEKVLIPTATSILVRFYAGTTGVSVGDSIIVKNIEFKSETIDEKKSKLKEAKLIRLTSQVDVYNSATPSVANTFSLTQDLGVNYGAINFISTTGKTVFPTLTGATHKTGKTDVFEAGKIYIMSIVCYDGVNVDYWFKLNE